MSPRPMNVARLLLLGNGDENDTGLNGPVPSDTFKNLSEMAIFLGLDTAAVVKEWMSSDKFKPPFDELYSDWIQPQQHSAIADDTPRAQIPQFQAVRMAIIYGEKYGNMRYSSCPLDKNDFKEIDHYALCLFRLRKRNVLNRRGVFYKKPMTDSDVDARLWTAILHATHNSAASLQQNEGFGVSSRGNVPDVSGASGASNAMETADAMQLVDHEKDNEEYMSAAYQLDSPQPPRKRAADSPEHTHLQTSQDILLPACGTASVPVEAQSDSKAVLAKIDCMESLHL